jgi:cytochrome c biogenesis factor
MMSIASAVHPTAVFLGISFVLVTLSVLLGRLAALIEAMTRILRAWIGLRQALRELRR